MKRLVITAFLLLLACITITGACADITTARILLGDREASVYPSPIYDGKRVLAPLSVLSSLGATYTAHAGGKVVSITSVQGKTGDIATVDVNSTQMIPMDAVVSLIGGEVKWDEQKRALIVLAKVESVEFVDGVLKVNCSMPVTYAVGGWNNKLWLDINGAKISSNIPVYVGTDAVEKARPGQFKDTTARIALDLKKSVGYKIESPMPSAAILLRIGEDIPQTPQAKPVAKPAKPESFTVESVRLNKIDANQFEIIMTTTSKGAAGISYNVIPPQLDLNLSGGKFDDSVKGGAFTHPLLKTFAITQTQIAMNFTRPVAYDLSVEDGTIKLSVSLPYKSGGKLSEKLIVIDPGHGGGQAGAVFKGVQEKSVNYKIVNDLAAMLQKEGAKVIITRSGDVQMGLLDRSEVAINNNADFFISIHCNSTPSPESATGIETYYHLKEPSPMALAYAMHAGVCSTTGMCDRKARSDRSLYSSGLAVLRGLENSGIPGVLLECGYINNTSDCNKLLDSKYRAKLAEGIVAGLKAYISGSPIR